jgi:FkbM family methyltransferase
MASYIKKAKVQVDAIAFNKLNLRANIMLVLRIINRRRIPLPSAVYGFFNSPGEIGDDMGSENFLAEYMLPDHGKCFVDVGANVGGWTFIVAKKGFDVHAFEPGPKAFAILKARAKKYPNVHPYPYALGDEDKTTRLGFAAFDSGGIVGEAVDLPGGGTVSIALRRLDSLHLPEVGVLKIDTEGFEIPILQGAKQTIQRCKPRLIIEVHCQTGKAAQTFEQEKQRIEKILSSLGYCWTVHYRRISLRGEMQPFLIGNPTAKTC